MSRKILFIVLISLLIMVGCQNKQGKDENVKAEQKKLNVAVSIVPQATFVKEVAGELVNIVTLIPPGYSPANYQPTIKQMNALSEADVYFSIGVPTEKANILPKISDFNKDIKIIDLADSVDSVYEPRKFGGEKGTRDPHVWMSPKRTVVMVQKICEEMVSIDLDHKDTYIENAAEYVKKIEKVDSEIQLAISQMENKTFIIMHPSMGYFADDYGMEMIPLEKDGKKITASMLKDLIDFAIENDIKVIFYQSEFDSQEAETLASEIGGQTLEVSVLDAEYLENLNRIKTVFEGMLN